METVFAGDNQRPLSGFNIACQEDVLSLGHPRPAEVQVRIRLNRGRNISAQPPEIAGLNHFRQIAALERGPIVADRDFDIADRGLGFAMLVAMGSNVAHGESQGSDGSQAEQNPFPSQHVLSFLRGHRPAGRAACEDASASSTARRSSSGSTNPAQWRTTIPWPSIRNSVGKIAIRP